MKLYHGCYKSVSQSVMYTIKLGAQGFHLTNDPSIAAGYAGIGGVILCFETGEFDSHVGSIDKGKIDSDIKSGMEWVLKTEQHLVSFYKSLEDVYIL